MKNTRSDRYKSFDKMVDESKNVVVNESLNFVYKDLGYKKEQVIHATLHIDGATPHIHLVVVPLVKKI